MYFAGIDGIIKALIKKKGKMEEQLDDGQAEPDNVD